MPEGEAADVGHNENAKEEEAEGLRRNDFASWRHSCTAWFNHDGQIYMLGQSSGRGNTRGQLQLTGPSLESVAFSQHQYDLSASLVASLVDFVLFW